MGKIKKKDQDQENLITVALYGDIVVKTHQQHTDPHPGDVCIQCGIGHLDYDGLLNLTCNRCGYILTGCST